MDLRRKEFLRVLGSGLVAALALMSGARAAEPEPLTVKTSVALSAALDELKPVFEQQSHIQLAIAYTLIADVRQRVLAGETADVIIVSQAAMDDLEKAGKLMPGSRTSVANTAVSLAARAGAPKPDIATVDAFKNTLLAARSIAYSDPAKGGASGVYFAQVIKRLGIADQLKGKLIPVGGAQSAAMVAKGEAELGVGQASEIVPVKGAELVGPFPGEFASTTVFAGAIGAGSKSAEAAKSLFHFLASPEARAVLKKKGFEPG